MVEESADEDTIRMDIAGTEVLTLTNSAMTLKGTTPKITIGDGGAEDTALIFDGNAQDFHIGLDDSADDLVIGTGSTVGSNQKLVMDSDGHIGIGHTSPDFPLVVRDATTSNYLKVIGATNGNAGIAFGDDDAELDAGILFKNDTGDLRFFKSGFTEAARIDSSGNVGIGVTSIVREPLQVHRASSSDVQIHMTNTSTGTTSSDGMTIFANSSTAGFWYREAGSLLFATSSTERMRIDASGNVAMGSTTIFTDGSDNSGSGALHIAANNSRVLYLKRAGGNGEVVSFYRGGITSEVGNISISTSTTAYNTSSDYRLKENVNYEFNALDRLKQLKPARFNFIIEKDETVDGFLAHEVSSIVPEAITGEKDAVDKEGNPIYQGIDQSKLVPLLTKAIQELSAKVAALEAK